MTAIGQLPNGILIVCEERKNSQKVNFNIVLKKGSASEKSDQKGLLYLMGKSLLAGTETLSRAELAEEIENLGAQYGVNVGREFTFVGADCLAKDIQHVFALISDMLLNPKFDTEEIEKDRGEILQSLEQRKQKPLNRARDGFFEMMAGEAGHLPMGRKETVEAFTTSDLKAEHEALLHTPSEIVISFVGDVTTDQAEALAQKYFAQLKQVKPELANHEFDFIGGDHRDENDNEQLNIFLGLKAPNRHSLERYTYRVLTEVVSGGMSSPLFVEVRDKRGLVYSVDANYLAFDKIGVFYIYAGTSRGQVSELLDVSLDVFEKLLKEGITEQDLTAAKARISRELIYKSENAENVCERNAVNLHHYGSLGSVAELEFYLNQITEDHLRQAAYDLLSSESYAMSNAGPQDQMPSKEVLAKILSERSQKYDRPEAKELRQATAEEMQNFAGTQSYQSSENGAEVSVLDNGLTIVSEKRAGTLSMGAWVRVGSDNEEPRINGITHMIEHMMFKGTKSYAAGEIDYAVEVGMGGDLNAYTSRDQTAYFFYSLMPEHLEQTVKICSEMVFEADLDHDEFDGKSEISSDGSLQKFKGERDVVIEEIKMYDDDVLSLRHDLLYQVAYPEQPHGRTILGPEKNIRDMTADDLKDYRDQFYVPNNVVFSAVGPIEHQGFVAAVTKYCGNLSANKKTVMPEPSYHGGIAVKQNDQARVNSISFFTPASKLGEHESYVWQALSELLTGGFSARLYKKIVNEERIAPRVSSSFIQYAHNGGFVINCGLPVVETEKFISLIYQEFKNIVDDLPQEELNKAKAQLEMAALAKMEANVDLCVEYGESALALDRPIKQDELYQEIQSITVSEVQSLAKYILNERPSVAMIVPANTDEADLPNETAILNLRDRYRGAA